MKSITKRLRGRTKQSSAKNKTKTKLHFCFANISWEHPYTTCNGARQQTTTPPSATPPTPPPSPQKPGCTFLRLIKLTFFVIIFFSRKVAKICDRVNPPLITQNGQLFAEFKIQKPVTAKIPQKNTTTTTLTTTNKQTKTPSAHLFKNHTHILPVFPPHSCLVTRFYVTSHLNLQTMTSLPCKINGLMAVITPCPCLLFLPFDLILLEVFPCYKKR